jgi:hypothetical protein
MLRPGIFTLLLLASGFIASAKQLQRQILTVPVSKKIVIDGKVSENEWRNAARIQGFSTVKTQFLMTSERCFTLLARDAENLYFAIQTSNDGQETGTGTVALVSKKDGNIWNDDCVELNISPNGQDRYVFIINSKGVMYDALNGDKSWNSDIKVANIDQSGCWTIEGKIPLSQLGGNKLDKIGINVCRTWTKYSASDAFGVGRYSDTSTQLILDKSAPVVRENIFEGMNNDKFRTELEISNPEQKKLTLTYAIKSIGKDSAVSIPTGWIASNMILRVKPESVLVCKPQENKQAKMFYLKKTPVASGDVIKLQVKAKGNAGLQPGFIFYGKKYIGSELAKSKKLANDWTVQTFVYKVPSELRGQSVSTFRVYVNMKSAGEVQIKSIKLEKNGVNVDVNGTFEKFRKKGIDKHKTVKFNDQQKVIKIAERLPKGRMAFEFSYVLKEGTKVYYSRKSKFEKGALKNPDPRPCTINKVIAGGLNLRVRHYPGFKRAAIELQPFDWKKARIARVVATLMSGGKKIREVELKEGKIFWHGVADLRDYNNCVLTGGIRVYGNRDNVLYSNNKAFSLKIKSFDWEGKKLGISSKVIKPFTPLKVKENCVESILRKHTLSASGLLEQVNSLGKNILAGPMTFKLVSNGTVKKWQFDDLKFIKKDANEVQAVAFGKSGAIKYKALITFDYDGFIWVKVKLSADSVVKIDTLSITIPLKSKYCTLMHAFADRIRNNPSGYIPAGKGKVWDSKKIERRMVRGKLLIAGGFTPYIWLGEEARGLCWFADCSAGFSLQNKTPQMRIYRNSKDVVTLEVDIINKSVELNKPRSFEFGMQATPVKPQPEGRRNWNFSTSYKIPGMLNIGLSIHGRGQAKASNLNSEPINSDYSYIRYLGSVIGTGKENPETIDKCFKNVYPAYLKWIELNKNGHLAYAKRYMRKNETYEQFCRRFLLHYMKTASKIAAQSDRITTYTDPRLCDYGNESVDYYSCEWWSPQPVSYLGVFRSSLTPSQRDFFLNIYKNIISAGEGKIGIYIDDSFLVPGDNVNNGTAVMDQDGKVHPRVGILALRDLVKRLAVLMDQKKISPRLLMIHMTNSLIIPAHSFCDITYDWEMEYGSKDFQNRFSLDFIRAESTGKQIGALGAVLEGIHNANKLPGSYKSNMTRLTRTSLALQLLHEIVSNTRDHACDPKIIFEIRKIMHEFGIADKECKFIGYWQIGNKVKVTGGNFKCSYYIKGNKILLIVSNMGDKREAHIYWEKKKAKLVDLENGQIYPNGIVDIPKHDFKILLLEKK